MDKKNINISGVTREPTKPNPNGIAMDKLRLNRMSEKEGKEYEERKNVKKKLKNLKKNSS